MINLQGTFQTQHPVALVTGSAAPRVGRVIAERLASLGCHVVLHGNRSIDQAQAVARKLESDHGIQTLITQGPLDDPEVPQRLVSETVDALGRIDILVNSAAIWSPTPLEDITPAEIQNYLQINTVASFLAARAAGLVMASQPAGGSIINIGDWATVRPYMDHAAYFPSKGSIEVMTRSLAVELAQRNPAIRVNCIQPGPVLLADDVDEVKAAKIASTTLANRVGTAEHVAHAVEFLCQNDFVNGVCLPVDGGRSIYAPDGVQVGINTG